MPCGSTSRALITTRAGEYLLEERHRHQAEAASQEEDTEEQLSQSLQNSAATAFFYAVVILILHHHPAGFDGIETAVEQQQTQDRDQQPPAAHLEDLGQITLPPCDVVAGQELKPDQRNGPDNEDPDPGPDQQTDQAGTAAALCLGREPWGSSPFG